MSTLQIGQQLVELCRAGDFAGAIGSLYAEDIVSVEPHGDETMPAEMHGLQAIKGKNEWWVANHEVHGCEVGGPFPNGERFAVTFALDVTPTSGPHTGKRMQMQEVALYTVHGGKIVREEFYYNMGG